MAVDWLRAHIEELPILVNTKPTAQMPPSNAHIDDDDFALKLARSVDPEAPREPTRADWSTWRHVPKCELWQAVLLSCGFEPGAFLPRRDGLEHVGGLALVPHKGQHLPLNAALRLITEEAAMEIHRRLKIAVSNVGEAFSSPDHLMVGLKVMSTVRLPEFGSWAATVWSDIPSDFPRQPLAGPKTGGQEPTNSGDANSLGTKERTTLLLVIRALAKMANVDTTQPTKAAKLIVSALDDLGAKIGQRTVEEYLKMLDDAVERRGY